MLGALAAAATVEPGRPPHSLHAYFVRSGDSSAPIHYHVERIRDGRSFSHRSVVARQGGREVFRQMLSFQVPVLSIVALPLMASALPPLPVFPRVILPKTSPEELPKRNLDVRTTAWFQLV